MCVLYTFGFNNCWQRFRFLRGPVNQGSMAYHTPSHRARKCICWESIDTDDSLWTDAKYSTGYTRYSSEKLPSPTNFGYSRRIRPSAWITFARIGVRRESENNGPTSGSLRSAFFYMRRLGRVNLRSFHSMNQLFVLECNHYSTFFRNRCFTNVAYTID